MASLGILLREVRSAPGVSLTLILFLLAASAVLESVSIGLLVPVLALSQPTVAAATGAPAWYETPEIVIGAFTAAVILQAAVSIWKNVYFSRTLTRAVYRIRLNLYRALGGARWDYLSGLSAARISQLANAEIDKVNMAVFGCIQFIQNIFSILILFTLSALISPNVTFVSVAIGVVLLLIVRPLRRRAADLANLALEQRLEQAKLGTEFVQNLKFLKAHNAEAGLLLRLKDGYAQILDLVAKTSIISSASGVILQAIVMIIAIIVIYVSVTVWHIELERLFTLVVVYMRLLPRILSLNEYLQGVATGMPAYHAIQAVRTDCERAADPEPLHSSAGAGPLKQGILLREVSFSFVAQAHTPGRMVVSGVSFFVRAGATTALVGRSGAGKTTVTDMIMGLLVPASGEIEVDGQAISKIGLRAWRDAIGFVPQDPVLFHDTVAVNLRLSNPAARDEDLWLALEASGAADFVRNLDHGLDTIVGDRGARLSGGERQRIAFARALLKKPQLLVLDEATSALDPITQQAVSDTLAALRGKITILMIAHRGALIAMADEIVLMDDGQVVEAGSFEHLMANPTGQLRHHMSLESHWLEP